MRILIGAFSVALLVGCSTSAVSPSQAQPAPPSQLIAYQNKPSGEFGELQLIRDSGQTGSLCAMAVYIDGRQAGRLEPGQKASFYLPPGAVTLGAEYTGSGICSMGADRVEREASVRANVIKHYRISTDGNGRIDVLPSTF